MLETLGILIALAVLVRLALSIASDVRRANREEAALLTEQARLKQELAEAARTTADKARTASVAWEGYRKFEVVEKVPEAESICSIYLAPYDRKTPLPPYRPGQFLTFGFRPPGDTRSHVRCYSLSDAPRDQHERYRITVKKVVRPPGADPEKASMSAYIVDTLNTGDIVDVRAPRGDFTPDFSRPTARVLLAGGVGITPMLSMLNAIVERGDRMETWLFYGVINGEHHVKKAHLEKLAETNEHVNVRIFYSKPRPDLDVEGRDYHYKGHVNIDALKKELKVSNYKFYVCGPPPMMTSISQGLKEWKVPATDLITEAFGPASVKETAKMAKKEATPAEAARDVKVTFAKSGKTFDWDPKAGCILDFAESRGIKIPSGCRSGSCETCLVAVRSGEVSYVNDPPSAPERGTCLTCISIPNGNLEMDA